MGHGNHRPEIELIQAFMLFLITSNLDDDLIKNERGGMETPFSHFYLYTVASLGVEKDILTFCLVMGNFLDAQGQLTQKSVVPFDWNLNSYKILCMSSLSTSIKRIG